MRVTATRRAKARTVKKGTLRVSRIGLAVFDIDGTLRRIRSPWWHLHQHLGVADAAAAYRPRYERGEISYEEWAALDAALWRGCPRARIDEAVAASPLRDGAAALVGWFRDRGVPCVGVSTGLSVFARPAANAVGLDEVVCNELLFDGETCAGAVTVRATETNKGEVLERLRRRRGVAAARVVAFGDGRADLPMLRAAGWGVAVCPADEALRAAADCVVDDEPIDRVIPALEQWLGGG